MSMSAQAFTCLLLGWLAVIHWLGDFVWQSHYMSVNKSKDNGVLMQHVIMYTSILTGGLFAFLLAVPEKPSEYAMQTYGFCLVNGVLHFFVDWCTSRWTSSLWKYSWRPYLARPELGIKMGDLVFAKPELPYIHNFFVAIGFDQMLHAVCLITTAYLFLLKP